MKYTSINTLATAMGYLALTASYGNAAIIQTNFNNGTSESAFDSNASATDLINNGQATLGSSSYTETVGGAAAVGTFGGTVGAHDGSTAKSGGYAYWNYTGSVDLTFTLAGSATGYDITSINTIYGWGDSNARHSAQNYSVYVASVATPTIFTLLYTVDYDPFTSNTGPKSTQVTLTDDSGVLASGVGAIRFTVIDDADGSGTIVGVIHEFDVNGTATAPIPEPTTTALFGLGGLALILRRRK